MIVACKIVNAAQVQHEPRNERRRDSSELCSLARIERPNPRQKMYASVIY